MKPSLSERFRAQPPLSVLYPHPRAKGTPVMSHPLLAHIPDELLERPRGSSRRLEQWCTDRNFRPTLLDLDDERRRRGIRTTWPVRGR